MLSRPLRTRCTLWSALILAACGTASAQQVPRTSDGKPNFQGIWQARSRAAYDLQDHSARLGMPGGTSVVEGGSIPYLPEAAAKQRENFANRQTADPLGKCYMPGVPRIMYMESPFQIFQTAEHIAMAFEWSQVYRLIYVTSKPPLHEGFDSWMGSSRARWEGDTLVVEVTDHNDKTWFDMAGDFHSDALRVTERYTMRDADTIQYEATINDPKVFTKAWKISVPMVRQKNVDRLLEYHCQAETEEATGAFERDPRTWYPEPGSPKSPLGAPAVMPPPAALPALRAGTNLRRTSDGKPDLSGYYTSNAGGANYGLERHARDFLTPATRGVVIDPTDGTLPYQAWARAERINRELPYRGYDDPTAHCFVAGVPRGIYTPSPFQILQTPGYVVLLFERARPPSGQYPHVARRLRGPLGRRYFSGGYHQPQRQDVVERSGRRDELCGAHRGAIRSHGCREDHLSSHCHRSDRVHASMDHRDSAKSGSRGTAGGRLP